jgi:hypothetical protein
MIAVVRGYITNLRVNVAGSRPATKSLAAATTSAIGLSSHRLVNKSLVIAGSAHRDRPINPVNLLGRDRKTPPTNLRHKPPSDEIPIACDAPPSPTSRGFLP